MGISAPPPASAVGSSIVAALLAARRFDAPFRHWLLDDLLSASTLAALHALPFAPVQLNGESGRREIHNNQRTYLDAAAIAAHPVCAAVAAAFQDDAIVAAFAALTGAALDATLLRIEFAQDAPGFFLEPHTDLGVKALSLLCYLPRSADAATLGTDIYADPATWVKRTPFEAGGALLFVPCDNTWHGFEKRPIAGVRRSLIVNYVTSDWRAREQLAFPTRPVRL